MSGWSDSGADYEAVNNLVDHAADVEDAIVTKVTNQAIWRKILSLSPGSRDVIILHYFEDLSIRDIANILGCSEQVIKTRLHRARRRLKDVLLREGGPR